MKEVTIVGLDLAKRAFQVHGATAYGGVAFRKKLSRGQLLAFFSSLPSCMLRWKPAPQPTTGHVRSVQPMRSQLPKIARNRYRRDRRFGNVILAFDRAAFNLIRIAQQCVQILVGDAQQRQIKIVGQQLLKWLHPKA